MKVINPNKKSDFVVLTWHKQHKRFESPKQLKLALIESFPDHVPSHLEFQIGYFEGRSSHSKRWIISINDVDAMYEVYMDGDDITLWCDGKNKPPRKRKKDQSDSEDVPLSKREAKEEEQHKIFNELKEKHGNKSFSDPQLRLWAKLIQSGMHSDYENPPNIPLITGQTKTKKSHAQKNDETSLSGAIVTAVNALASVIKPSTSCSKPSTPTSTPKPCTGISPMSRATLRRSLYTDLQTLQKLYEDSILSASEFEEQKTTLLEELKDLKKV